MLELNLYVSRPRTSKGTRQVIVSVVDGSCSEVRFEYVYKLRGINIDNLKQLTVPYITTLDNPTTDFSSLFNVNNINPLQL